PMDALVGPCEGLGAVLGIYLRGELRQRSLAPDRAPVRFSVLGLDKGFGCATITHIPTHNSGTTYFRGANHGARPQSLYADRAARRHRHSWGLDRPADPRGAKGPCGGEPGHVQEQPETDWPGTAQLP